MLLIGLELCQVLQGARAALTSMLYVCVCESGMVICSGM